MWSWEDYHIVKKHTATSWGMGGHGSRTGEKMAWQVSNEELESYIPKDHLVFGLKENDAHITVLEYLALITHIVMNVEKWRGKYVQIDCDNKGAQAWINGMARPKGIWTRLSRDLEKLMVEYKCTIKVAYIESELNVCADRLSREELTMALIGAQCVKVTKKTPLEMIVMRAWDGNNPDLVEIASIWKQRD